MNAPFHENPGNSELMKWIQVHINYEHDWCLIWPFGTRGAGYGFFGRDGKNYTVHRYICEQIHGPAPSENHLAAHSCGRGHDSCVNPRHLSWKTHHENQMDRTDMGNRRRARLTPEQVEEVRRLKGVEVAYETAKRFGVSESAIRGVQSGRTWRLGRRPTSDFSDADVQRIRSLQGKMSAVAVGKEYGVSHSIVYRIWHRQNWAHVPEVTQSDDLHLTKGT